MGWVNLLAHPGSRSLRCVFREGLGVFRKLRKEEITTTAAIIIMDKNMFNHIFI